MEEKKFKWLSKIGLASLCIVALYGVMMRYKIVFNFPFLIQKNLLHAHSHFAFSGWVSHFLYCGLAMLVRPYISSTRQKKYYRLIVANLLSAFGMLIAFTIQGYKAVSITFSTISIIISIAFAFCFIVDVYKNKLKMDISIPWATAGLLLNVLSAAGPLSLGYMMATKNINTELYLSSIYYYLHFQYNGWFFFGSMAIAIKLFPKPIPNLKNYFAVFTITIIPAFLLSIIWAKIPLWLYIITVLTSIVQLITWLMLVKRCWSILNIKNHKFTAYRLFFYFATFSLSLKFLLQALSVIPSLNHLVFGSRPIVIAYLHLVLLGVYSFFILGDYIYTGLLQMSRYSKLALRGFFIGVVLNELFLGAQGIGTFSYTNIPYINTLLLVAALILFISILSLTLTQLNIFGSKKNLQNTDFGN